MELVRAKEILAILADGVNPHPYGNKNWVENVVRAFGLESTIRPVGRPKRKVFSI